MFMPVIAMLHNTKLKRWHPIVFVESPLPGPDSDDKPVRHKSKGHHTTGFATRQEALDCIKNDLGPKIKTNAIGEVRECVEKDFAWDGEDTPAMTVFFGEQDGKTVPMIG
jgi:hypothetical protein